MRWLRRLSNGSLVCLLHRGASVCANTANRYRRSNSGSLGLVDYSNSFRFIAARDVIQAKRLFKFLEYRKNL